MRIELWNEYIFGNEKLIWNKWKKYIKEEVLKWEIILWNGRVYLYKKYIMEERDSRIGRYYGGEKKGGMN